MENYPGLPRVAGSELGDTLAQQAQDLGAQLEYESVTAVTPLEEGFQVDTDCGSHTCKGLILATGVRHRPLGLPSEEELVGQGISYCAVCDGPFCKGKPVAVVGGGRHRPPGRPVFGPAVSPGDPHSPPGPVPGAPAAWWIRFSPAPTFSASWTVRWRPWTRRTASSPASR